jgi:CMP-N,N'-diacetyllegionaminic acid synthase
MKILYLIPARGGSKGLKKKNILKLVDKPMINYTLDAVLPLLGNNDEVCVSTDNKEIKEVVEKNGIKVPFIRPNYLASDSATTKDVINHALEWYSNNNKLFDLVVLLQPTSPLRTSIHIKECLKLWNKDIDMIVSVKETDANPYYVLFEEDQNLFLKKSKEGSFTRRQDCPKVYEYNGAIYVISVDSLKHKDFNNFDRKKKYLMSKESSIDVDDFIDFNLAELMIKKLNI